MILQLLFGGLLLSLSAVLQVLCLGLTVAFITRFGRRFAKLSAFSHAGIVVGAAAAAVVVGHTLVVWVWALAFLFSGALPDMEQAIYFTLVTYTTLGYGDLVLGPDFRVFGSMAAVTGLLNFGLSTAFLVALVSGLFSESLKSE